MDRLLAGDFSRAMLSVASLPTPSLPVLFLCPPTLSPWKLAGRLQKYGSNRRLWKEENDSSPGAGDEMPSLVVWVPAALVRLN